MADASPGRPPRRRAARGQGELLRGEILTAAIDLLTETGDEEAVSLRAVAERVGVSVPSIYLHFADKQALLDAVCAAVFEALHVRMRQAAQGAPHAFEALRRQGIAYVEFALENPEHYRIVLMRKHGSEPPGGPDLAIATGAFGYLVESVSQCVDDGLFEGDATEIALRLWAAAHGVAALLVAKPYFPWPPLADFIDQTIRMAGLGLLVASRTGLDCEKATLDQWRAVAAAVAATQTDTSG
ncbi:MAG: TetR/AcrR family transcriptional regulator [Actinomycetota bacterium]|nr:TetR/AcrR family transcriptional regulator [Actinomycetota bacterium]